LHQLQEDLSRTRDFGRYHLVKLLGSGGMGEVWLARHSLLRRDAAVKLILPELLERARPSERRHIQERFESEAQAIASLRSPHTIAIYDYGLAENGSLYYAMEYLQGGCANPRRALWPQPAVALCFLRQRANRSKPRRRIIHRDIKPSNSSSAGSVNGRFQGLDFGLVKELALTASAGWVWRVGGTRHSWRRNGAAKVDARTDIYGFGCLAYFLLTGTMCSANPMAGGASERTAHAAIETIRVADSTIARGVVMACLEKQRGPAQSGELGACTDAPTVRHGLKRRRPW
jgi:serine/threonine-protein kinase